jgi:16S rRNA (guanine1516-N2)-methyltransferase
MKKIAVYAAEIQYRQQASALAKILDLPLFQPHAGGHIDYLLTVGSKLSLVPSRTHLSMRGKGIYVDFLSSKFAYRLQYGGGNSQLIAKAVGLKKYGLPLKIVDVTAGLGQDAFVLASLGCQVHMIERSLIIYMLLQDAWKRALNAQCEAADRLTLLHGESVDFLRSLQRARDKNNVDIIYLDPMYTVAKRHALPKKALCILREVVGDDEDAAILLKTALACYAKRVVLKQPRHAKNLIEVRPSLQFVGKSTRFDVFLLK